MDLQVVARVVTRFRVIFLIGLCLAAGLAFLSFVRVGVGGGPLLTYRESEQWESLSTLFVTTHGFPWGEVQYAAPVGKGATAQPGTPDTGRLSSLASLYMELATSDAVLNKVATNGKIEGTLQTFPVFVARDASNPPLPMVTLSAISSTPERAHALAVRHLKAFRDVLERRQVESKIPEADRVVIEVVRQPNAGKLLAGRKMTRPIVVFLAVLIAVCALCFVLENIRPRVPTLQLDGRAAEPPGPIRRTA